MIKYLIIVFIIFLSGCSLKQPKPQSATILIKTPTMKFYDRGFITQNSYSVKLQVYSAGVSILDLDVYEDRVCRSTFECEQLKIFNKKNLSSEYEDDFLYKLLSQNSNEINFKDKKNKITIRIIKD